jgi:hypothetical protein
MATAAVFVFASVNSISSLTNFSSRVTVVLMINYLMLFLFYFVHIISISQEELFHKLWGNIDALLEFGLTTETTARRSRNQNFKVARIEARFFLSNLNNGLNLLSQWLIGISRLQSSIKFQRAAGKQHVLRRAKLRPILAHVACLLSPCH